MERKFPTPTARARQAKPHHHLSTTRVLSAMRNGACLYRTNSDTLTRWSLSSGGHVEHAVAQVVIARPDVTGVGDTLFGDRALSQTFRYVED